MIANHSNSTLELVRAYHERTKHHFDRYAAGPEYLDWEQQPNPFRLFEAAPQIKLPLDFDELPEPGLASLSTLQSQLALKDWGLTEISSLLRFSMGLAAWKVYGPDRWSLRCNPSSGNLHPTETYLLVSGLKSLKNGVYHYAPYPHALELRAETGSASQSQPQILLAFSSIAWREAWKYGERAYRYVQLDIGHAIGALAYSAAALGYYLRRLPVSRQELAKLLGFNRQEDFKDAEVEYPDLIFRLQEQPDQTADLSGAEKTQLPTTSQWHGTANRLSQQPSHHWPLIDELEQPLMECPPCRQSPLAETIPAPARAPDRPIRQIILQRRSAQAFNGKSSLPLSHFYRILDHCLPRANEQPWKSWPYQPRIHLLLFVHRVEELSPGLYLLPRSPQALPGLKQSLDKDFSWQPIESCPAHILLHQLVSTEVKKAARALSCHQDIAASSFFSLGMLAEFDTALQAFGPLAYPELFWEAGLIGQVLYLQAEAHAVRGTGIGCFFDDAVHQIAGVTDSGLQSLYHFTVGEAKPDNRLQTLPAYHHLGR
ncbi:MAG: SagB family peptide dehydrogenase [Candidatus Thiodiazotropha lotti]|nr:SagB family peptide dehydrogenase [Candidatus Thiodiazotropha lotti]MCG7923310.1 SagB family peptide dehydrogenase [Candidatus Thiodiazotropha lotti]MCG7988517.1 SagB family peptide dehydrogenase [Candidatus Thiodiazotropha lotti]MCG8008964.1 SagB family peptide dehydrogenase [Candidatus Thiodiazotropha lotti]MCG8011785.1 SagB family peptide dehydrogenase [Candidatus Thiodiazotropha lotti]